MRCLSCPLPLSVRILAPTLLALATLAAQSPTFELTVANIMRGPDHYGREPRNVRWSADGRWIYFLWNPPGTEWSEPLAPYRVRAAAGAAPERLSEAQVDSAGLLFAEGAT